MDGLSYFERAQQVFCCGDPVLRGWFLFSNGYHVLLLCTLYVIGVKWIGPSFMKHRSPFDLRLLMIIYNFLLVLFYSILVTYGIYMATQFRGSLGKYICESAQVSEHPILYRVGVLIWIGYIIKYVEFLDTIFFILRKKNHQITDLHVLHHALVPIVCWIGIRVETNGFQIFVPTVNCFVHIIMYSYYGLAAIGPSVRKYLWWKRYLTIVQMSQFVIFFFLPVISSLFGCKISKLGIFMDISLAVLFFFLFRNYYKRSFNGQQSQQKGKTA